MNDSAARLARVIERDANGAIDKTLRIAESDIAALLSEYMSFTALDTSYEKTQDGYRLTLRVDVSRFYGVGNTSESE